MELLWSAEDDDPSESNSAKYRRLQTEAADARGEVVQQQNDDHHELDQQEPEKEPEQDDSDDHHARDDSDDCQSTHITV